MRGSSEILEPRRFPALAVLGGVLAVPLLCAAAVWLWYDPLLPKRFAPVVEGKLYRSGLVKPEQLEHLQATVGIKRVISLLNPDAPESVAEKQAAERLGIEWQNIPLPGDGASTPQERDRIRALLDLPGDKPTLIHCAAGSNRTGLAIGMYRLHKQGWPLDRVMADMRAMGFEDKPKHQELRDALAAEAELAARTPVGSAAQKSSGPVGGVSTSAASAP